MHWLDQPASNDAVTPKTRNWTKCPACNGYGSLQLGGSAPPDCAQCGGFGLVRIESKEPMTSDTAPDNQKT